MKIKKIIDRKELIPTYDFEVDKIHHYLLSNWCVSHNTSLLTWTTAWLLPIYKKYFVETNSVAPIVNVAPWLSKENFWFYKEYIHMNMKDVIKVISTIQK